MNPTDSPEFVHMPVPASLYATVIHTISDALRNAGLPDALPPVEAGLPDVVLADDGTDSTGGHRRGWSAEEITALRPNANAATAAIFTLAAERPGQLIPFADVVDCTGYGYNSTRSGLGGLTRSLAKRGKGWPFRAVWGPDIALDAQMYYEVPIEHAQTWQQAPPGKWEERGPEAA